MVLPDPVSPSTTVTLFSLMVLSSVSLYPNTGRFSLTVESAVRLAIGGGTRSGTCDE